MKIRAALDHDHKESNEEDAKGASLPESDDKYAEAASLPESDNGDAEVTEF